MGICLGVAMEHPDDEHAQMRAAVFVNMVLIRQAMHGCKTIMPENKLRDLQAANFIFHISLNWMASYSIQRRELLWKIRPKLHQLDHVVMDQAQRCNPLWVACYADEDYVGKIKKMAALAVPTGLEMQVLQRYCAFVCTRWRRQVLTN
ncbi:unnamed protein product [Cladocopium goreaui]|uniref:Uncharacterized protein n=1 Tax=Cladocopium goreaui TaxID=2562237 RepID=A0A9P1C832_9DINO|nr:unnamed protein product [Cladocopium goreaui]